VQTNVADNNPRIESNEHIMSQHSLYKVLLLFLFLFIAGCNEESLTVSAAASQADANITKIYGKVLAKAIVDSDGANQVSYKVVDSQGINFWINATKPLSEGTWYVFSLDQSQCSEEYPCELLEEHVVSRNYWWLLILAPAAYIGLGCYLYVMCLRGTVSKLLESVTVLYPFVKFPISDCPGGGNSVWQFKPGRNKIVVVSERMSVVRHRQANHFCLQPTYLELNHAVSSKTVRFGYLVVFHHPKLKLTQSVQTTTRDNDTGETVTWYADSVEFLKLESVPTWFQPNYVIQLWFDKERYDKVHFRGGIMKLDDQGKTFLPELENVGRGLYVHRGDQWDGMGIRWAELTPEEYILICPKFDAYANLSKVDFNLNKQDFENSLEDHIVQDMVAAEGFIRMKVISGRRNQK
jgi:hypothetical protein